MTMQEKRAISTAKPKLFKYLRALEISQENETLSCEFLDKINLEKHAE